MTEDSYEVSFDVRVITQGYDFWLQPVLLAVLYGLVAASAWLNRKALVVRLIGASQCERRLVAYQSGVHSALVFTKAESSPLWHCASRGFVV